jgi:hypothetical protein
MERDTEGKTSISFTIGSQQFTLHCPHSYPDYQVPWGMFCRYSTIQFEILSRPPGEVSADVTLGGNMKMGEIVNIKNENGKTKENG